MKPLYVLLVDKAWAKLYKADLPPTQLALVYHQALFGGRVPAADADEDLARSLCRLLRADRQTGKFKHLVMLASTEMLAALRRQYDGDWDQVTAGRIENLPSRHTDEDLVAYVHHLLEQHIQHGDHKAACESAAPDVWKKSKD
jgi:hypothetical protein